MACPGILALAGTARANGAFPDSEAILLPDEDPHQVVLGTNFGLVISEDDGATWRWICESPMTTGAHFFSLAAVPSRRLFTVSREGLARSDDRGCTWDLAGGALTGLSVVDAFPDPVQPGRVLAAAWRAGDASTSFAVFESLDGGMTFGEPLLRLSPLVDVSGLETAASDPRVIVVTTLDARDNHPRLVRSLDAGRTWTTFDLQPFVSAREARIIAVNPGDARQTFLRVIGRAPDGVVSETLAVVTDHGDAISVTTPVVVSDGRLTAFLHRPDGTILAAGVRASPRDPPVGFRSRDGGQTFQPWNPQMRMRSLRQRSGRMYAAADNILDGMAVAVATDEDGPWRPLMNYASVLSVRACGRTSCQADCAAKATLALWDQSICAAPSQPLDAAVDIGGDAAPAPRAGAGACGCRLGRDKCARGPSGGCLFLLMATCCAGRVRRRFYCARLRASRKDDPR